MLVVKVGGASGIDYDRVIADIAELWREGQELILVHGASALTNELSEKLGHPPQFVTSVSGYTSRRTDRRTLEIFEMAYCGQMNKSLVEKLQRAGVNAIGLSGMDGRIWEGPRKDTIKIMHKGRRMILRDDYTGKVEKVNTALLRTLLEARLLPVLTPPAISDQSEAINVDGDRAAAATAVALGADTLLFLSNVPGLLRSYPDESTLIPAISATAIAPFMRIAEDRMKKKVMGAQEALRQGVGKVVFADGRVENPVRRALAGEGTVVGG